MYALMITLVIDNDSFVDLLYMHYNNDYSLTDTHRHRHKYFSIVDLLGSLSVQFIFNYLKLLSKHHIYRKTFSQTSSFRISISDASSGTS